MADVAGSSPTTPAHFPDESPCTSDQLRRRWRWIPSDFTRPWESGVQLRLSPRPVVAALWCAHRRRVSRTRTMPLVGPCPTRPLSGPARPGRCPGAPPDHSRDPRGRSARHTAACRAGFRDLLDERMFDARRGSSGATALSAASLETSDGARADLAGALRPGRRPCRCRPGWRSCARRSNEPLRPPVVAEPFAATEPLSLIFQFQLWPDWLLSTSPSTSRRPSSVLTLSFQSAPPEQLPVLMTRSSSPPWEAYEGAPTTSSAVVVRAASAAGILVMGRAWQAQREARMSER